jgi:hypothetical protein
MATWDRRSARGVRSMQDRLLREQLDHVIAPWSPLWRQRFADLGRSADAVRSVADLADLPPLGERDVSPSGDPAGMAAMVLQADAAGHALHAPGPQVRRALWARATRPHSYRRIVDADTRATSFAFSGLGFRYPLASTRSDLDVIARAGARLWSVLGLTRDDVLVSAVPREAGIEHLGLEYAALAAGAPALFPGTATEALTAALRLTPPTVLAVPSADAAAVLATAGPLPTLTTLLLVGAPTDAERNAARAALTEAGATDDVAVLGVHAPSGARLLWGECRESGGHAGLHTYPDLDIVQVVDPDTGEAAPVAGELVLTQIQLHGSALLRWRTGDVVSGIATEKCPSCGRGVPRVQGTQRAALVVAPSPRSPTLTTQPLDLRSIAAALVGRDDVADWRVAVGRRDRDGAVQVVVHLAARGEVSALVLDVASKLRAVAGAHPTQIVMTDAGSLAALPGAALSEHLRVGPDASRTVTE